MLTCSEATTRLATLDRLKDDFLAYLEQASTGATTPAEAKVALEKAKQLKVKLEQELVEFNRELGATVFTVPDAVNPYAARLKAAGMPATHAECTEKKEMTVDLTEIALAQADRYRVQGLSEWSEDIIQNLETLFDLVSTPEEGRKIEARIKAGMIPLVMPSRGVQLATWQKAFNQLKPEWIIGGTKKALAEAYTYEKYPEKMTGPTTDPQNSFFRDIPERPYLVWTQPTTTVEKINPEWKTTDLSVADQRTKLEKLHTDHPDLVDAVDLLPTEYAALQSITTRTIEQKATATGHLPTTLLPLDDYNHSYTRFLSGGLFSDGYVPSACFIPGGSQLCFDRDGVGVYSWSGFRPAARS